MAQSRMNRASAAAYRRPTGRGQYVYGNAAPKIDIRRELEEEPKRKLSNRTRRNRDKARHMSMGYVLFLCTALVLAGFVLLGYIQLQSELTNEIKHVSRLERQLNTLKMDNDEEYNRIVNSVDLEAVKRVAIGELGMVYASEGQVITYENSGNDYMRRVSGN